MKFNINILIFRVLISCFGIASFALVAQADSKSKIINVGYFEIKPHAFMDEKTNQASGASVEYLRDVADKLGYEVSWHGPYPFPRLIQMLKDSSLDAAVVFTHNKEREKYIVYAKKPYYYVNPIIVVRQDNPLSEIMGIENLIDYRIGYLTNGNLSPIIKNNLDIINLELMSGKNWVEQNILKLISGRLDAVYDLNQNTMLYSATLLGVEDQIKIIPLPEKKMPLYVVFAKASPKANSFYEDYSVFTKENTTDYNEYVSDVLKQIKK